MSSSDLITRGTMQFFALFIKCPFGQEAQPCPFGYIRNRELCLERRFQIAEELATDEQKAGQMWRRHTDCYRQRLAEINQQVTTDVINHKENFRSPAEGQERREIKTEENPSAPSSAPSSCPPVWLSPTTIRSDRPARSSLELKQADTRTRAHDEAASVVFNPKAGFVVVADEARNLAAP